MKIIHINFSFTAGGIDTMMVDIMNHQIKFCEVELIVINDLIDLDILQTIDKRVKRNLIRRPIGSKNPLYFVKLNLLIFKSKPDFIHCHNNKVIDLLYKRKNTGLTIHALDLPVNNLRKFDVLFAISNEVKDDIKRRGYVESIVIHNGINFNLLKKAIGHKSTDKFRIVQVSRLDHISGAAKGQHILIKALDILTNELKYDDIFIDFIGEGASLDYLQALTKELGLDNKIQFVGNKERRYIYEVLPKYNLLVQPSLNEGFGLTILEGIGSSIPVLASDSNGPAEISKTLDYDFIFETGNSEKLADAIIEIYKKKNDFIYLNELDALSLKAENLFSIEQTANNYIEAYKLINIKNK